MEPVSEQARGENHETLSFEFETYEDLLRITEYDKVETSRGQALGLGMKMVADVVRINKDNQPFDRVLPLVGQIVDIFKGSRPYTISLCPLRGAHGEQKTSSFGAGTILLPLFFAGFL